VSSVLPLAVTRRFDFSISVITVSQCELAEFQPLGLPDPQAAFCVSLSTSQQFVQRVREGDDGGIAGDTMHAIFLHQSLELTAREQVATDVVQPDGLSTVSELLK
jgi:hypothetical protein